MTPEFFEKSVVEIVLHIFHTQYRLAIPILSNFTGTTFEKCKRRSVYRIERASFAAKAFIRSSGYQRIWRDNLPSTKERCLGLVPPVSGQEQIKLLILKSVSGWWLRGQGRRDRRQQGVGRRRRRRGQGLRERCRRKWRRRRRGDRWGLVLSRRSKRAVEHRQRPCDHVILRNGPIATDIERYDLRTLKYFSDTTSIIVKIRCHAMLLMANYLANLFSVPILS